MDCERDPLLPGPHPNEKSPRIIHHKSSRNGFTKCAAVTLCTIITVSLLTYAVLIKVPTSHNGNNNNPNDPQPTLYPGETIPWAPCGAIADRPLECANLTVPMDHFANPPTSIAYPSFKTFTIALVRLRSRNPTPSTRNLLINPGGPGGSGTGLVFKRGALIADIVGDGFHILGFDPRGVNASSPRVTCFPNDEARQRLSAGIRAKKVVEDSGELFAWMGPHVKGCAEIAGEHAEYVNTPQTAADMNSILDGVGQKGMVYWGFSYGTILGQTYATMFPDRAERVIVDGVANQFDWYQSRLDREMWTDTDRVLEGFVEECLKAGKGDCALADLAGSKEELLEVVVKGVEKLRDEPVGVYVNSTVYGVLDYWAVWHSGVFPGLYKSATWRDLADNLAALFQGNATPAYLAYGLKKAWEDEAEPFQFISNNDGVAGPEYWPSDRLGLVEELVPFFNESKFGDAILDAYFSKQIWSIPHTHEYVPKRCVKTAHPVLILTTSWDPVCPVVSAQSAEDAFEHSRIVEVKGYGHCSISLPSTCVAKHIRNFLYDGKLPDERVTCEADGNPYFAKPEETLAWISALAVSEEDSRIRLAQQELAKDFWPSIRRGF
ncbi:Alpha/Beta hydrolase protein [Dichotomopilus funicola]|uniref:Alpha/Beta hydrolase protein n=1 Tax=Dichotomopilus funicola TaxID=1934379 RepID=A0AAN6V2Z6_9PEZI|nr:Alpha/Beta hydrolase protein [Dichotomopilus funicola]